MNDKNKRNRLHPDNFHRDAPYKSWRLRWVVAAGVAAVVMYFASTDEETEAPIVSQGSGLSNEVLNVIPSGSIDTNSISTLPSSDSGAENEVVLDKTLLYNIYSSRNIAASGKDIRKLTKAEQTALFIEFKEKGLLPFIADALQYFDKIGHKEVLELIFGGFVDGNTNMPGTLEALIKSGAYQSKELFDIAYDQMGTNAFKYITILSHDNPEQFMRELMKDPKLAEALPYIQSTFFSTPIEEKIRAAIASGQYSQNDIGFFRSQSPIIDTTDPVDFQDMNGDFSLFATTLTEQEKKTLASQGILQKMLDAHDYMSILENSTYFGLDPTAIRKYADKYFESQFSHENMYRFIRLLDSENTLWTYVPDIIQQVQYSGKFQNVFLSKTLLDAYGRQRLFDDLFSREEYILLGERIFTLNPSRDSALLLATKLSLLTKNDTILQSNPLGTVWDFLQRG